MARLSMLNAPFTSLVPIDDRSSCLIISTIDFVLSVCLSMFYVIPGIKNIVTLQSTNKMSRRFCYDTVKYHLHNKQQILIKSVLILN